jgi:hypothetical protein
MADAVEDAMSVAVTTTMVVEGVRGGNRGSYNNTVCFNPGSNNNGNDNTSGGDKRQKWQALLQDRTYGDYLLAQIQRRLLAMKMDGSRQKNPLPFPLPHFIVGSGSGSGTIGSGNSRKIYWCTKMNQHVRKLTGNGQKPETLVAT